MTPLEQFFSDLAAWMKKVDAACEKLCGVSIHDLTDCPFSEWFEDGLSPTSAARRAIRRENGGDD